MPTTVANPSLRLLRAVRARIEAVADIPSIAYLGVRADDLLKEDSYLQEKFWRGDSALAELGDPTVLRRGPYVYQIDLVVPSGGGPDAGLTLADAICTAVQGLQYAESGTRVRGWTERTAVGPALPEPPNAVRFPLTMYLRLDF